MSSHYGMKDKEVEFQNKKKKNMNNISLVKLFLNPLIFYFVGIKNIKFCKKCPLRNVFI